MLWELKKFSFLLNLATEYYIKATFEATEII